MIESNVPELIQTSINENNSNSHSYASYLNESNGLNNVSSISSWYSEGLRLESMIEGV